MFTNLFLNRAGRIL